MKSVRKIVLIGPESTGKTTLCEQLANHYASPFVPEYAREYLTTNGAAYSLNDLDLIAREQLLLEDVATEKLMQEKSSDALLFLDTDLYVIKVWSEVVFNQCSQQILRQIANRRYDLYLLCAPDIEWVQDGLREYPNAKEREKHYHHYRDALIQQRVPWIEISGNFQQRIEKAICVIDQWLGNDKSIKLGKD